MSREMVFVIEGMDCAEEVAILKRELGSLAGGEGNLRFDLLRRRLGVAAGNDLDERTVIAAVARTGMRAQPWREPAAGAPADGASSRRAWRTGLTAASGLSLLAGFASHVIVAGNLSAALGSEGLGRAAAVPWVSRALYLLAILCGSWFVLPKAAYALRRLRPDMNFLMVTAVAGALAIGDWLEAATVSFLFAVSLALEAWSVGRARRAVEALLSLTPPSVHLVSETGEAAEQPAAAVAVGSLFQVRPGERFGLDGVVEEGRSTVDLSPITGESVAVAKGPGDEVFAGSVNGESAIVVRSTKTADETLLAGMLRTVAEAERNRAPAELWVERFARIYTPAILLLALLVVLVPPLLLGREWSPWIYSGLVLLVIGCPCALVISTPVSMVAGLTAATRHGVLVKGGAHLESAARWQALALDKTGTLTAGRPRLLTIVPLGRRTEPELLSLAASLEAGSLHPLAKAILGAAAERGIRTEPVREARILPGEGVEGRLGAERYWLGSHAFLEERGLETPEVHARLEELAADGQTVVVVGSDREVLGFLGLADPLKPSSIQALRELEQLGIEPLVLLTGDNRGTAERIAAEAGLSRVHAELRPADKVRVLEDLLARHGRVAMIGDGVNDAPALARATTGIAMGALGSDAAIEAADVALMDDDLLKVPWLVRHARRTMGILRQNITFALAIKAVFAVLTLLGHASMWAAIAADMGASLLVVGNGLRLLRGERGKAGKM